MRRRIWQFLLPIHHDVSSDRAWWLPYREPCESCQSPTSAGLGSPGDRRSRSGHVGNTRRRQLITCCRLWPAARRFLLGLHLVGPRPADGISRYPLIACIALWLRQLVGHAIKEHQDTSIYPDPIGRWNHLKWRYWWWTKIKWLQYRPNFNIPGKVRQRDLSYITYARFIPLLHISKHHPLTASRTPGSS